MAGEDGITGKRTAEEPGPSGTREEIESSETYFAGLGYAIVSKRPKRSDTHDVRKGSEVYFAEMGYRVVSVRPKRKRAGPGVYSQVRRRAEKRAKTGAYMESGRKRAWSQAAKEAIVIGRVTVDRIVDGGYEWRDGGLQKRARQRTARRTRDPG